MQIILSGNSPGELWGWVRPVASRLQGQDVSLFLFPCPYATGREKEVAKSFGISKIYTPKESLNFIFRGKKSQSMAFQNPIILHLGGDVMYAALLARRLRAKAYAYQWANKIWDRWMTGYFVSDEKQKELLIRRGIHRGKISVVGNLLLDGVMGDPPLTSVSSFFKVTFLPGSREAEVYHMLPFYLRIAELIEQKLPGTQFRLPISPFMTELQISKILQKRTRYYLDSSSGYLEKSGDKVNVRTENGTLIEVGFGNQYTLMKGADCIVTVPGTKCGEAGLMGVPMLVLLPTNRLDQIPYPGIADLVAKIPFLGPWLKRVLGARILPKIGFLAQPNILAGKAIVPEFVAKLDAESMAEAVVSLLRNPERRREMSNELRFIYSKVKPGTERLVNELLGANA